MKVFPFFFSSLLDLFPFLSFFSFVIVGEEEEGLMGANGEQHGRSTRLTPARNESKLRPAYARRPTGDAKGGRERERNKGSFVIILKIYIPL